MSNTLKHWVDVTDWGTKCDTGCTHSKSGYVSQHVVGPECKTDFKSLTLEQEITLQRENQYYKDMEERAKGNILTFVVRRASGRAG